MARMIPLHIPATTESSAERTLFDQLEHGCPADWIVLHSLDLARRGSGPFGEADFVVIAPGYGILCIEAKTYLARTADGLWLTSPKGTPEARGPFQQVGGAQHRILEWIRQHEMSDVLAAAIVVVPDVEVANKDQIDWAAWQLVDRPRFHAKSFEQIVCESFDAQRGTLAHPPAPLTPQQAERIVHILRSEIECYVSPRARIEQQLDEVRRYTPEQFRVLDQLADNPRLVIDGLAGSGKTMLAIESARRAAESGRHVLFLCFNRLLAEWLAEQTAPLGENCRTCTIHEFMQGVVGEKWHKGLAFDYWEKDLPERVFCKLADLAAENQAEMFDELVIDEAQDILLNDAFLSVLDTVLAQGLENGRWRFFGDFFQQDIFGRFGESPRAVLAATIGFEPPLVHLRENCRNLPRVAALAGQVAGLSAGDLGGTSRDDDGVNPRVVYYDGAKTQRKALVDALGTLVEEGFKPGEIVVLSRHNVERCCAASIDTQPWGDRLKRFVDAGGGYTGYDSIFRFKGREAPAVVVTDIDPLNPSSPVWADEADVRSLLYVAATRSLSRLVILADKSWRGQLDLGPMDATGLDAKEIVAVVRQVPPPEATWFVRPNGYDAAATIHGLGHTRRVLVHALAIADALAMEGWEREALTYAALWHDIGRTNDGADYYHGAKSAGKAVALGLHRDVEQRVYETALYAVTHHCGSEEHGERAAEYVGYHELGDDGSAAWTRVESAAALRVFKVLKDADALDRVRLGDLGPSYLRYPESRERVASARELLREMP